VSCNPNTVSQLPSHHHYQFEICGCQNYPLEWKRDGSHFVPDQGCMLDVPRFPTRIAAGSCQVVIALCDRAVSCRSKAPFISSKRHFCLMAALNCSSFLHYAPALIFVLCCMKPTNNTPLWSQNMMATLNCFDPGCFHYKLACFHSNVWSLTRLVSSNNALKKAMAINDILLLE
jgi:hypothetical protein